MNKIMTIKSQMIRCTVMPEDSIFDMTQDEGTLYYVNGGLSFRGRSSFRVDGFTVFAEDLRTAKMLVRWLLKNDYLPRGE